MFNILKPSTGKGSLGFIFYSSSESDGSEAPAGLGSGSSESILTSSSMRSFFTPIKTKIISPDITKAPDIKSDFCSKRELSPKRDAIK